MKKILWTLAVIAMAALSCTKQENGGEITPKTDGPDDVTYLKINSVTTSELVKSAIKDTKFPTDEEISIGLFVVGDAYADEKYSNIKCTKPAGSDKFTDPQIELVEGKTATVYAYYPYDGNIAKTPDAIKAIPVASSVGGDDWMWATPVTEVSTAKPAIDLTFNHALALVEITFDIFAPSDGMITELKIATGGAIGGSKGFYKKGTLNAQNGKFAADSIVTTSHPLLLDVSLPQSNNRIIAECLLVPAQYDNQYPDPCNFYIACEFNGKYYYAQTGLANGVQIVQGYKSTIHLNIKDSESTMEVESVGVAPWTDPYVSGNTATIDGHKVTFNFDKASGLNPSISFFKSSVAITMDDPEDMPENTLVSKVVFKYDPTVITDEKFISCESGAGCSCVLDKNDHTITVTDVTQDVTVNVTVGNSTRIFYTAKSKVEPYDKTAMGVPFDAERSTFDAATGNGVMYFDGIVTTIGTDAFKEYSLSEQNKRLTGITIPESVTSIGLRAFQSCTILETVSLPDGLTTIDDEAFEHCYKLKPQLPASLETMGQKAFNICKEMTSIDLSNCTQLKEIKEYTFNECESLAEVKLPAGLETIGTGAFKKCGSLKKMTLASDAAPALGSNVFENVDLSKIEDVIVKQSTGHATLLSFKKANGWKDIPNGVIREKDTKVSIIRYTANYRVEPKSGTSFGEGSEYLNDECCSHYDSGTKAGEMFVINFSQIGAEAFSEYAILDEAQKKLTSITIPEGVTSIGAEAFRGCIKLESVALPENLTTLTAIGDRAFEYCQTLKIPALPASLETLGRAAFNECKAATSVDLSKCTGLKTIPEYCFNACTHLAEVKLPNDLETIEKNAFWHMGKDIEKEADWKPLNLPSSLKEIGQFAFEDSRFTSLTLPAALKTVGTDIFKYSSVKTLTIEDGAVLSRKMFNSCFQLTTIICKSTTPPNMKADDGLYAIANEDGNKALTNIQNIYVPASSVDAYKSAPGWDMYSGKISAIQ